LYLTNWILKKRTESSNFKSIVTILSGASIETIGGMSFFLEESSMWHTLYTTSNKNYKQINQTS